MKPDAPATSTRIERVALRQAGFEGDGGAGERLRDGASGPRLVGDALEVVLRYSGYLRAHEQVAARDAHARLECDRRRDLKTLGRRAVLREEVRELHREARRVRGPQQFLGVGLSGNTL